jgi:hypothetical protein
MKRVSQLLVVAVLACGGGQQSAPPQFELRLASSAGTLGGDSTTIDMQTGETRSIAFMLVGSPSGRIAFSAQGLPTFATLSGPLLMLTPTRRDQGEFMVTVTASAGAESASISLRIVVHRQPTPPTWVDLGLPYFLSDDKGPHHKSICPGPYCTTVGTPKLTAQLCDDSGDAINFEVEVVPRGQPFVGRATHSSSLARSSGSGPSYPTAHCGTVIVALTGLVAEQSYAFRLRISDEFGVVAASPPADAGGWVYPPAGGHVGFMGFFEFDQGPCTTRTCSCVPSGRACEAAYQCCSGASGPYTGGLGGFFSGDCR